MEQKMLKYLTIIVTLMAYLGIGSGQVAAESNRPELVVYTYDSFTSEWGPGPQIKAEFEKTCNCTLTFVGLDSSVGILSRIQFEGTSTKADVVLGLDTSLTAIAADTGLFLEHGLNTGGKLALPADIGNWSNTRFIPFDWGYFAFNYDASRLTTPPSSFEELLDPDNDLKIIIQDPRTATPGLGLMLWVNAVYGDDAQAAWARLAPKLVTVTKGWSDAYSLFLEGEADLVLSYSTSPAYHLIAEGKDHFAAAAFAEGHYMQVEVAGVLKSSDHPALGLLFLEALMEAEMQSILPTTNWMYPAAKTGIVPDGFKGLIKPVRSHLYASEEVAKNRKDWTSAWIDGLSQ
jgi:thiamine transport system substrate-binding protein